MGVSSDHFIKSVENHCDCRQTRLEQISNSVTVLKHCIANHIRYFKVEQNYFEKVHRNEITSKRDGKTTLIFKISKTYQ